MAHSLDLDLNDFAVICRACLRKGTDDMFVSLTKEPTVGVFIRSTHIYVERDRLPMRLCRLCLQRCTAWLEFRTMVENNDRLLHSVASLPVAADTGENIDNSSGGLKQDETDVFLDEDTGVFRCATEANWDPDSCMIEVAEVQDKEPIDSLPEFQTPTVNRRGVDPVILCPVPECMTEFVGFKKFEQHILKNHVQKDNVMCAVCDLRYERIENLKNHMYVHTNQKFECPECDKLFSRPKTLNDHLRDAHLKYIRKNCEMLPRMDTDESGIVDPLVTTNKAVELATDNETKPLEDDGIVTEFSAAYLKSLKQDAVSCPVCHCHLDSIKTFEDHIGTHISRKFRNCPICKRQFKRTSTLKYHLYSHTNISFTCANCPRTFVNPKTYNDHLREAHDSSEVATGDDCDQAASSNTTGESCAHCGKFFKSRGVLREHLKLHMLEKKHQCHICSMTFRLKATLRSHMTHKHKTRAVCVLCTMSLRSRQDLRNHMLKDHQGTELMCDLCGNLFKSNQGLACHKQIKHTEGASVFICDECGRTFNEQWRWKEHQASHSVNDEKPFACKTCGPAGQKFRTERGLNLHVRTMHKSKKDTRVAQCL